ncbi:hypothetical protein StoSoilB13_15240 [Arthrobacter sp. StoSoilB13]|nr:hypothetical protein StoSoilB13_15240 [Arthrobacter sp. StoSoilB13]
MKKAFITRRKSLLVAASAALALSLRACGGGSGTTTPPVASASFEAGTTMAKLNQAKKITIGTKFDQPLFGQKGLDGKPVGFDVEIGKAIAAKLGIELTRSNGLKLFPPTVNRSSSRAALTSSLPPTRSTMLASRRSPSRVRTTKPARLCW